MPTGRAQSQQGTWTIDIPGGDDRPDRCQVARARFQSIGPLAGASGRLV